MLTVLWRTVYWWVRGIYLLRQPSLIRGLGDWQREWAEVERVRTTCPGVYIHRDVLIRGHGPGVLQIGTGSSIEMGTILWLGDERNGYGALVVGRSTWIGQYNNFRLADGCRILIGG
jgi:hypothetical protein